MTHHLDHALAWAVNNTDAIGQKDAERIMRHRATARTTWHKHKGKYKPSGNRLLIQKWGSLLRNSVKSMAQSSPKLEPLLGCTIQELREKLEGAWKAGMGWHNFGRRGWVVDHVRAQSTFDLSDPAQLAVCYHFSNLQPLWEKENNLKRAASKLTRIQEVTAAILDGRSLG